MIITRVQITLARVQIVHSDAQITARSVYLFTAVYNMGETCCVRLVPAWIVLNTMDAHRR